MCRLLTKIPLMPLLAVALLLGLAPVRPEPHLIEKVRLLLHGQLQRPLDIFDLGLHGVPVLLLLLRLSAMLCCRQPAGSNQNRT